MLCWHMNQFGLLGLARLRPLLRLRRYNFLNRSKNCMVFFSHGIVASIVSHSIEIDILISMFLILLCVTYEMCMVL